MHLASPKSSPSMKSADPQVVISRVQLVSPPDAPIRIPWFKRLNWFFILGMGLMFLLSAAIWLVVLAR